jgi:hypothetical protein
LASAVKGKLITMALELGWSLWAYEPTIEFRKDKAELLSLEFTSFTGPGPDPWVRDELT